MEENNLMGKRIKRLRQMYNLTQAELAGMLGVQFSAVNKWESGAVKNIKQSTIKQMATIFDVDPSYLMGFTDSEAGQVIIKENNKPTSISSGVYEDPVKEKELEMYAAKMQALETGSKAADEKTPEETYILNKYRSMATPQQRRLLAYLMGFCKGADLDKEDPS